MPFQFLCPQGHLLEGVESQMGQQCQCPLCGTAFIVPVIGAAPAPQPATMPPAYAAPSYAPAPPAYSPPPNYEQPQPPPAAPSAGVLPDLNLTPSAAQPSATAAAPAISDKPPEASEQQVPAPAVEEKDPKDDPNRIVRIPCPKGHELHTPMSMIGMDAMCPECGEQFNLRYEDSIEGKEEREQKQQEREERMTRIILKSAIGAAVVVGLAILTMILLKAFGGSGEPQAPPQTEQSAPVEGKEPP